MAIKRLPTETQLGDIFGSLRRVDLDKLQDDLEAAIKAERRVGHAEHDGWRGGTKWGSSTEMAAIARAEGRRPKDPQREELERAIEDLVRGTAQLVQAKHRLEKLALMRTRAA